MIIREITDFLERIAPLRYQEVYDNSGLIIGDHETEFKGAVICLDSTPEVVDECISLGYNLIIAHHPVIFKGLKRINSDSYIGKAVIKAIKNNICIYAIHTNLDNAFKDGVSAKIAFKLGFKDIEILNPKVSFQDEESIYGTGIIANLENDMHELNFLSFLKHSLNLKCIKYTRLLDKPVRKVAICGGSCSFLIAKAISSGADVFISSDFKYHDYFDAENRILIADIGHYESEIFTIELIFDKLINNFNNFAARLTTVVTNPIKYL
ncbi:MAG: Nif3-like dinuclear metal center hexameric protein [Saprospiraceae bacterium]|nr:Nif3-like dinuclear metal center hexameric protein [Saprospiraceae bacterium]